MHPPPINPPIYLLPAARTQVCNISPPSCIESAHDLKTLLPLLLLLAVCLSGTRRAELLLDTHIDTHTPTPTHACTHARTVSCSVSQHHALPAAGRGESLLHDGRLQELLGYDVLPVMRLLHAQMAAACAHLAKLLRAHRGHQKVSAPCACCMLTWPHEVHACHMAVLDACSYTYSLQIQHSTYGFLRCMPVTWLRVMHAELAAWDACLSSVSEFFIQE